MGFFGTSNFALYVSVELKNPAFGSMTDDTGAFRERLEIRQAMEDIILLSIKAYSFLILREISTVDFLSSPPLGFVVCTLLFS